MNALSGQFQTFDPVIAEWSRADAAGAVRRALVGETLPNAIGYHGWRLPFVPEPASGPAPHLAPAAGPAAWQWGPRYTALAKAILALVLLVAAALLLHAGVAGASAATRVTGALGDIGLTARVVAAVGRFGPGRGS